MKLVHGSIAIDDVTVYVPESHPSCKHWRQYCEDSFMNLATSIDGLRALSGDYLFLISCSDIIRDDIKKNFRHAIVIHESDLPKGRGWSPLAWQILEGKNKITVSAIKCDKSVDTGDIITQSHVQLDGTELYEEIHEKVFKVKAELVVTVVADQSLDRKDADLIKQVGEPSYYPRRTPADSRIDCNKSIAEQFDLLRICEPRFPAFFDHRGCRYNIFLDKFEEPKT